MFCGEEQDGFFLGEQATGDVFFRFKFALGLAAFVGRLSLLEVDGATHRAGGFEIGKDLAFCEIGRLTGFATNLVSVGDNLLHEITALEKTLFHLAKFELPVAGESWRVKSLNFHFSNKRN